MLEITEMNKFPIAIVDYALAVYGDVILVIGGLVREKDGNWNSSKTVWEAALYNYLAPTSE